MAIDWTILGTYLGRTVKAAVATTVAVSEDTQLTTATVLLAFARDYATSPIGKPVLHSVIASCPIAIAVAGVGAEAAFDDLLEKASHCTDSGHIMTAHLDDEFFDDLAEGFLFGVMPAEKRFKDWTFLGLLVVEDSNDYYQRLVAAINKWIENAG